MRRVEATVTRCLPGSLAGGGGDGCSCSHALGSILPKYSAAATFQYPTALALAAASASATLRITLHSVMRGPGRPTSSQQSSVTYSSPPGSYLVLPLAWGQASSGVS